MQHWRNWIQQPTTIAGLSAALGTLMGLALQQITLPQAVPLLVGAAISMVLPDNAGARQQAESLAEQVVRAIQEEGITPQVRSKSG